MRKTFLVALFGTIAMVTFGCGKPEPAPVKGVVRLDGQPLAKVLVKFNPDDMHSTKHPQASAFTDEHGAFELRLDTGKAGAMTGLYRITVFDPPKPSAKARATDPNKQPQAGESAAGLMLSSRTPKEYADWNTTPLRQEVIAGENIVQIELSSKLK